MKKLFLQVIKESWLDFTINSEDESKFPNFLMKGDF